MNVNDLGNRHRWRGAPGPVVRSRVRRRPWEAAFVALVGVILIVVLSASAAQANSPAPGTMSQSNGTIAHNADGTVTINVQGTWLWPYTDIPHTEGLRATVVDPCDHRFGAGWGIVWNDPKDSGYEATFTVKGITAGANVGSRGVDPLNTDDHVQYNRSQPCGVFTETNEPNAGDGNVAGPWTGTHTYADAADVPAEICVVTYDLGFNHPPLLSFLRYTNIDNSIMWSLKTVGSWSLTPDGTNCFALSHLVPTAPTTTTTTAAPPVVKPVSHVTPPPTPKPVTKPSGTLAFTGFGTTGRLMTVLGALLVMIGLVLYFVDVRRLVQWVLGL